MKVCVYVDAGCASSPAGGESEGACAVVVVDVLGRVILEHSRELPKGTNNHHEYSALREGIRMTRILGADEAHFVSDSLVVVRQTLGYWAIKNKDLSLFHSAARSDVMNIPWWSLQHVKREHTAYVDRLVNVVIRPDHRRAKKEFPTPPFREARLQPGWANLERGKASSRTWHDPAEAA